MNADAECLTFLHRKGPGGRHQLAGSSIFGRRGSDLELMAVTLHVGVSASRRNPTAVLGLVFPARQVVNHQLRASERYTALTFDIEGGCGGCTFSVGGQNRAEAHFRRLIGLQKPVLGRDGVFEDTSMSGGNISLRVGFPGAEGYFARNLPLLGEYLTSLARSLEPNHEDHGNA